MKISDDDYKSINVAMALFENDFRTPILEKDILVTRAIQCIASIDIENVKAIFCGGTCLSKAYKVIKRMSEDVDFKIVASDDMTKSQKRKYHKTIKDCIVEKLKRNGFDNLEIKSMQENSFFRINIPYESRFANDNSFLRPYIKIECKAVKPLSSSVFMPINTIVDEILHLSSDKNIVPCFSMQENMVEKIVAMLRRLTDERDSVSKDKYLLRHVYDVSQLSQCCNNVNIEELNKYFSEKIAYDSIEFAGHCKLFANDPIQAMTSSLQRLIENRDFEQQYNESLSHMVYHNCFVPYSEAIANFCRVAQPLINSYDKILSASSQDTEEDSEYHCSFSPH